MGRAAVAPLPPEGGANTPVFGMYAGDDAASQEILLGFEPLVVLALECGCCASGQNYHCNMAIASRGTPAYSGGFAVEDKKVLEITNRGFLVFSSKSKWPQLNNSYKPYYYIAFR